MKIECIKCYMRHVSVHSAKIPMLMRAGRERDADEVGVRCRMNTAMHEASVERVTFHFW